MMRRNRTLTTCGTLVLLAGATLLAGAQEETCLTVPMDALPDREWPVGIDARFDPNDSADGNGSLVIRYAGGAPVTVIVAEMLSSNDDPLQGCTLEYTASLKGEELAAPAYLEMLCEVDGNAYFSRALNDPFTGTTDWRASSTPFFLRPQDPPVDKVLLGVRMEGAGTVKVDGICLTKQPLTGAPPYARWAWMPGTGLGIAGGLFGILSGVFASRGRGRTLLLAYGWGVFFVCVGLLIAGLLMFVLGGYPLGQAFAIAFPGALGSVLFGILTPVLSRRCREAEMRRLAAMDM
ncbi:MAG: hypothetical protein GY851_20310 [bacterium]|nr:hypothetical protein [bacterium]